MKKTLLIALIIYTLMVLSNIIDCRVKKQVHRHFRHYIANRNNGNIRMTPRLHVKWVKGVIHRFLHQLGMKSTDIRVGLRGVPIKHYSNIMELLSKATRSSNYIGSLKAIGPLLKHQFIQANFKRLVRNRRKVRHAIKSIKPYFHPTAFVKPE